MHGSSRYAGAQSLRVVTRVAVVQICALALCPRPASAAPGVDARSTRLTTRPTTRPASMPASRPASMPASRGATLDLPPAKPPQPKGKGAAKKTTDGSAKRDDDYRMDDERVVGHRRTEVTSAVTYAVEIGHLKVIPRKSAAEQLMLAPGVLTTSHGGEGHANEVFMRGFAAREGQDIEFLLDGVPLNEISNAHGHGYADLFLIPPELVTTVTITEGPFDAEQGDFAFAGSANYRLGVAERGARISYGLGRFNTHRMLMTYAPRDEDPGTFAATELYQTGGFGENRAAKRLTALGRFTEPRDSAGGLSWSVGAYGYAARYDQAGVLRQDDYLRGDVGFFDTYDAAQGGESSRALLSGKISVGPDAYRFTQLVFGGARTMRMRSNFTGWQYDVVRKNPDGTYADAKRGDLTELRYQAVTLGARGSLDLAFPLWRRKQRLALGYAIRLDSGRSQVLNLDAKRNVPYRRVLDKEFTVLNVAAWMHGQLRPLPRLAVRGGLRVDGFSFGVNDLNLRTQGVDFTGYHEPDQTIQALGFAINPRGTVDVRIWRQLHGLFSYGQGTRSVDAFSLSDNETAPFALAHVFEAGMLWERGHQGHGLWFKSQLSYCYTYVDRDMIFSPESNRTILVGESFRHAVLLGTRFNYDGWLDALLNAGYSYATYYDKRAGREQAGVPSNPKGTLALLPYIPQLVLRLDLATSGRLFGWKVGGVLVAGRFGVGFTFVPGRPLPARAKGDAFYWVNLGGSVRVWHVTLGLEIRNLLDLRYRQSEFNFPSNFIGPDAITSDQPMRHFAAGEPFFAMGTLTIHLEALLRRGREPRPAKRRTAPAPAYPPIPTGGT